MSHITSIITSPESAKNHEYIVLGRSLAGKYVNIGYTPPKSAMSNRHYWYKVLTDHYIEPVNDHLGQSNDTLDATLLIANTSITNDAFNHILQRGAGFISQLPSNQTPIYTPDHAKRWARYSTSQTHFNQVTELEQLTIDTDSIEARLKYGAQRWHNQLVTVFTQNRKHYIFACNAYNSLGLIESYINEQGKRPDPILWVLISDKTNAPHLAVIKELLSPQRQVRLGHLVRFINPTGNLHTSPAIGTKQAGYTKLPFVLMLLIGILLLGLSSCTALAYTAILSNQYSGQASRDLLAFFVPDHSMNSQIHSKYSATTLKAYLSASRDKTLISMANQLPADYDGVTSQNKIANRQICGAVSILTESEPRHPIPAYTSMYRAYSVTPTQNNIGAIHHG